MPPRDQIEDVCKMLEPIAKKGLFCIPGNHEERSMRAVGLHPDEIICSKLWIPYVGYSCMAVFSLNIHRKHDRTNAKAHYKMNVSCYFHHNYGGGWTNGGKVSAAGKLRLIAPTVDATFSAHLHTTSRLPVTWFEPGKSRVLKRTGYDYIIGSALTWNERYAEEKAKRPATIEQIKVNFGAIHHDLKPYRPVEEVRQTYQIIQ
jgi:hypothetical protein